MRPGRERLQRPPSPVRRTRVPVKAVFRTERKGLGSSPCFQCRSARHPDTSEARSGAQHHVSRRHCQALPVRRPQRPPRWGMGPSQCVSCGLRAPTGLLTLPVRRPQRPPGSGMGPSQCVSWGLLTPTGLLTSGSVHILATFTASAQRMQRGFPRGFRKANTGVSGGFPGVSEGFRALKGNSGGQKRGVSKAGATRKAG